MYVTVLFIIIFLIFAVVLLMAVVNIINTSRYTNEQEQINKKCRSLLEEKKFKITQTLYLSDNITYKRENFFKKFIASDKEKDKICLVDYENSSLIIIDSGDILSTELYENGGYLTFGGGVGVYGNVFGASSSKFCRELKLIIRIKNYQKPYIYYDLIMPTLMIRNIDKSSNIYRECLNDAQRVISFFEVIIKEHETKVVTIDNSRE